MSFTCIFYLLIANYDGRNFKSKEIVINEDCQFLKIQ